MRIIFLYISMIIPKDSTSIIFGAWYGNKYADNPKYLYEYILKHEKMLKPMWITANIEVYNELRRDNKPVLLMGRVQSVLKVIRAKYFFVCTDETKDIGILESQFIGNAVVVNLWHGVGGGKKIGLDDISWRKYLLSPKNRIEAYFKKVPLRKSYFSYTSEEMKRIFKSAFEIADDKFIRAGQVRNDMFYTPGYNTVAIKKEWFKNSRIILYMPTHRKEGKQKMDIEYLFDLQTLNAFCENEGCTFIIKKHFYHAKESTDLTLYPNIYDLTSQQIDSNELLLISDYLITDYSSCAADYLLLDRPIFYYCFDYEQYISTDRDLYWDYEDITPGSRSITFDELLSDLKKAIAMDIDYYSEDRNRVKEMFYAQDCQCKSAERIISVVKKIK